jgi:8-oxo-dGTP pyrophosphatase MutT (NUDIX family)
MGKRTQEERLIREFSAGGVVFKKDKSQILWLIAQSSPSKLFPKSYWRLPKGWLDDNGNEPGELASGQKRATEDQIQKTALKEVVEEGGVKAKIISKIGTSSYFYTINGVKKLKFVTFYLMEWQKDLPKGFSWETSAIQWLEFNEAFQTLSSKNEKQILAKAREICKLREN